MSEQGREVEKNAQIIARAGADAGVYLDTIKDLGHNEWLVKRAEILIGVSWKLAYQELGISGDPEAKELYNAEFRRKLLGASLDSSPDILYRAARESKHKKIH